LLQLPRVLTEKYLLERGSWHVEPWKEGGLDVLFDAPSDLVMATFPDVVMEMLTVICGFCGGVCPMNQCAQGTHCACQERRGKLRKESTLEFGCTEAHPLQIEQQKS
jgi:hypothetical protein